MAIYNTNLWQTFLQFYGNKFRHRELLRCNNLSERGALFASLSLSLCLP